LDEQEKVIIGKNLIKRIERETEEEIKKLKRDTESHKEN